MTERVKIEWEAKQQCNKQLFRNVHLNESLLHRRHKAVQWINTIIEQAHATAEARDTAIQILDEFVQVCVIDQNSSISSTRYMSLAAAASAIVATKVHESSRSL